MSINDVAKPYIKGEISFYFLAPGEQGENKKRDESKEEDNQNKNLVLLNWTALKDPLKSDSLDIQIYNYPVLDDNDEAEKKNQIETISKNILEKIKILNKDNPPDNKNLSGKISYTLEDTPPKKLLLQYNTIDATTIPNWTQYDLSDIDTAAKYFYEDSAEKINKSTTLNASDGAVGGKKMKSMKKRVVRRKSMRRRKQKSSKKVGSKNRRK